LAILAFGTVYNPALEVAEKHDYSIADMRFVKPLDTQLIDQLASEHKLIVTVEENCVMGGVGSAVTEYLNRQSIRIPVLQLGIPDQFIDHGTRNALLQQCGLDTLGIEQSILDYLDGLTAYADNSLEKTTLEKTSAKKSIITNA